MQLKFAFTRAQLEAWPEYYQKADYFMLGLSTICIPIALLFDIIYLLVSMLIFGPFWLLGRVIALFGPAPNAKKA